MMKDSSMAGANTVDLSSSNEDPAKSVKDLMNESFQAEMAREDVSVSEVDSCTDHCDETGPFSSVKSDSDNDAPRPEEEQIKFTPEMTRNVFRLRVLVLLVLLLAAAAVSYVVFSITKGGETEEFESSYEGTASKVLEAFEAIVSEKLDAVASLAIAATAYSVDSQDQWPLSTVSFFQERATAARKQSGTLFASLVPLVKYEQREAWENYTSHDPNGWVQEGLETQQQWDPMALGVSLPSFPGDVHPGYIVSDDWELGLIKDETYGPYFPVWQTSPVLKGIVNFNLASLPQWLEEIARSMQKQVVVIGKMLTPPPGNALHGSYLTRFFATMLSIKHGKKTDYIGDPFSYVFFPVFDSFADNKTTVAVMFTAINWAVYFERLLPDNIVGVTLVIENGCDSPFTYVINGADVVFLGAGDLHEPAYDDMMQTASFKSLENRTSGASDIESMNFDLDASDCPYSIRLYPSQAFYNSHSTMTPTIITLAVAGIFIFTALMFMFYDRLVERRQQIILSKATHSTAILSSIYPKNIRDRLLADAEQKDQKGGKAGDLMAPNHRLKSFLTGSSAMDDANSLQPLADLFPHTTVIFADIAGFTAWSSVRDPAQVFVLLQNLYGAFDELAKRRRVFKIETIGDCYVAVTGLPHPQEGHAVIMARFAHDCLVRMRQITRHLVSLGPGTDELGLRVGLHSGPVTAGVLRGDRARFQLFGDTVNTAARMESTGLPNRIQCSQNTAALLIEAGKGHWVKARDDSVLAKGKGVLSTSWIYVKKGTSVASSRSGGGASTTGRSDSIDIDPSVDQDAALHSAQSFMEIQEEIQAKETRAMNKRNARLVDWVVEVLLQYIHEIRAVQEVKKKSQPANDFEFEKQQSNLDELVEIIKLPKFDVSKTKTREGEPISAEVVEQLRKLVTEISMTYHSNPFHNFEHACHVTMATHKFLQRIVAPDLDMKEIERGQKNTEELASHLYDYTLGINSDPVTRCAIIFSALIHDADHRGISNVQMAKEDTAMAEFYENKSIAEQNSLDIGWSALMSPQFQGLRQCLFVEEADFLRFRQVCVNVVLATDIFDKELNDQRKSRWNKAFNLDETANDTGTGLRATIVIEHIIQASDVSHTMQHWHVYRKWNRKLFQELSAAYKNGRMGADPATFWYNGELGFFDNYIIPLAKKLKECGVFGVSSEECLNYALQNRAEWEVRGEDMVKTMIEEMRETEDVAPPAIGGETDDEDAHSEDERDEH